MTVLVSSHNLKDMEEICDHIGIISNGKMVLERDLDTIKTSLHKIQVSFGSKAAIGDSTPDYYQGLNILHKENRGTVDLMIIDNDIEEARQIINKSDPILFDILPLSLEEVFIYELGGDNDEIRKLVF